MNDAIDAVPMELFFLGERDYVNGLTLFEELLAAYLAMPFGRGNPPVNVKSFQMNSFLRSHAQASLFETAALRGRPEVRSAATRLDLQTADGKVTLLIHADASRPVTRRITEYDRGRYIGSDRTVQGGDSLATLANITSYVDFVRGVVEVNHRFVTGQARADGISRRVSWAWLRNMPCLSDCDAVAIQDIRFRHDKTLEAGGRCYVVRSLLLDPSDNSDGAEFGFFY